MIALRAEIRVGKSVKVGERGYVLSFGFEGYCGQTLEQTTPVSVKSSL